MINVSGSSVTAVKELSTDNKQATKQNPPINTLAMGFTKSVSQDKKLADLSNKLQNIDEKTIRDFAKNLNDIGQGVIITDEIVDKAIKGLKYEGNELPELPENNTYFSKLDDEIKQVTQKMLSLNSASLVVNPHLILKNPDENMAILPIPILTSHQEKIGDIFNDEKQFSEKSKLLLPKSAQDIFDKNYPILRQKTLDEARGEDIKNIVSANEKDTQTINNHIVDNVANIYQMVTLRFLAQLGNAPNGVPNAVPVPEKGAIPKVA